MKFLHICSGLGGDSEAFLQDGWDVCRIENNRLLEHITNTTAISAEDFLLNHAKEGGGVDILGMGPPCTEFSFANPNRPKFPDLSLVKTCIEIKDKVKPRYWYIENVRGAIPHFKPLLGPPAFNIGPFYFWGNIPRFSPDQIPKKDCDQFAGNSPMGPNLRAKWPIEMSEAMLKAFKQQRTLFPQKGKIV